MSPANKMRLPSSTVQLLLLLSAATVVSATDLEDRAEAAEEEKADEVFEETSENELPLQPTTTEPTITAATYETLLSIDDKNISGLFKPSVHLGEIKEPRIGAGLFNNVQHIKFENDVDPSAHQQRVSSYEVILQPVGHLVQPDPASFYQSLFDAGADESNKDGTQQNGYVKFQDDAANIPRINYGSASKDQYRQQFAQSIAANTVSQDPIDQQVIQNLAKPVYEQGATAFYGKPSKFQTEAQKHELGSPTNADPSKSPYFGGFYEQQGQQPVLHEFDAFKRPNNGVVYVQESTFLSTRKFPYSAYQPSVGYHQVHSVDDDRFVYPVRRRVSPWKKILHLIGAFLPFGLLLAALTPNTVKVDNTTQPNIVLSKWRVADLPVEHKQARFAEKPSGVCEERSICELISAGSRSKSSVLQSLLWNLATRTSSKLAKENDLQEIFDAAKKKDCTKFGC